MTGDSVSIRFPAQIAIGALAKRVCQKGRILIQAETRSEKAAPAAAAAAAAEPQALAKEKGEFVQSG